MTGIGSGEILKYDLVAAGNVAKDINKKIAEYIGINISARLLTIKPSGTTSCILGTASGIHAWHAEYYLRTIRFSVNEEIAKYLLKNHPELCEIDKLRSDTLCVRIPIKAPKESIYRTETAIDTLERVKKFSLEWVKPGHNNGDNTHNVSATISIDRSRNYIVRNSVPVRASGYLDQNVNEWEMVGHWMWINRDNYNGLSVLPYDNGSYVQAPFQDISKVEYDIRINHIKDIDLTNVTELDDNVSFGSIVACGGGACEII